MPSPFDAILNQSRDLVSERLGEAMSAMLDKADEALSGYLEKEKDKLNAEVENLRSFEREYRSRLKSYFQQQLAALDGSGEGGILAGNDHAPKRLKSLLGDENDNQG